MKDIDVFISYRRDGGDMTAMYIYQALKERGYEVFYDLEVLRAGKFNEDLLEYIQSCKDFILVLSPHALDRCENEDDWVRKEIAEAIRQNKNIVPVMMKGFTFPQTLPEDIDSVRYHSGLTSSTEYFQESMNRLCDKFLTSKPRKKKKKGYLPVAVAGAAIVVMLLAGFFMFRKPSETGVTAGAPETAGEAEQTASADTPEENAEGQAGEAGDHSGGNTGEQAVINSDFPVLSSSVEANDSDEVNTTDEETNVIVYGQKWSVMGNDQYTRDMVKSIEFLPSLESAPETAWDVSEDKDGRIKAWLEDGALTIAGDGGVKILDAPGVPQLFSGYCNMESISFNGCVDTSEREDWTHTFWGCTSLKTIDFTGISTKSAHYMGGAFGGCASLQILDLSFMDTSLVTDMGDMFVGCTGLTTLGVENFDTSRVRNMSRMFFNCEQLRDLDVSNFDTSKVSDMSAMFFRCKKLEKLDIGGWNTSDVKNFSATFSGCYLLENFDVSNLDTSSAINMSSMFEDSSGLRDLDVSKFDTSNVTNMEWMFFNCDGVEEFDVSGWNTAQVVDMSYMFGNCSSVYKLDLTSFDTSKVENMTAMFRYCGGVKEVLLTDWNVENVKNMNNMFEGCYQLESIGRDVQSFGHGDTTDMYLGCEMLVP